MSTAPLPGVESLQCVLNHGDSSCLACGLNDVVALQVVKMSIQHAGAPLKLEAKNEYMKRKIEERSLAPNSILNGGEQVCSLTLWVHACIAHQ